MSQVHIRIPSIRKFRSSHNNYVSFVCTMWKKVLVWWITWNFAVQFALVCNQRYYWDLCHGGWAYRNMYISICALADTHVQQCQCLITGFILAIQSFCHFKLVFTLRITLLKPALVTFCLGSFEREEKHFH